MTALADKITAALPSNVARQAQPYVQQVADVLQRDLDTAVQSLIDQAEDQGVDRSDAERAFRNAGLLTSAPAQDSSSAGSSDDGSKALRIANRLADLAERQFNTRVDRS